MWVKICANTNVDDARLAAELGAEAVGFVFAPSKRRVTVEQVAAITPGLPETVERIGVFTTQDAEEIVAAVRRAKLTGVQLHSSVDVALVRTLRGELGESVRLIQVIGFEAAPQDAAAAAERFESALREAIALPELWAVLLDAVKSGASGGLGLAFDWKQAAEAVGRVWKQAANPPKLIVAGGLRAENVGSAIAALEPFGVDVASGVEAEPGRKSPEKLREFLAASRG